MLWKEEKSCAHGVSSPSLTLPSHPPTSSPLASFRVASEPPVVVVVSRPYVNRLLLQRRRQSCSDRDCRQLLLFSSLLRFTVEQSHRYRCCSYPFVLFKYISSDEKVLTHLFLIIQLKLELTVKQLNKIGLEINKAVHEWMKVASSDFLLLLKWLAEKIECPKANIKGINERGSN